MILPEVLPENPFEIKPEVFAASPVISSEVPMGNLCKIVSKITSEVSEVLSEALPGIPSNVPSFFQHFRRHPSMNRTEISPGVPAKSSFQSFFWDKKTKRKCL